MRSIGLYAKTVVAAVTAAMGSAIVALTDGAISAVEWAVIVGAFLAQLVAITLAPNLSAGVRRYTKLILAGLIAGVAAVGTAVSDGWPPTPVEWLAIVIAVLSAAVPTAVASNAVVSQDFKAPPD